MIESCACFCLSIHSYRGPGIKKGLRILEKVKQKFSLPILVDIHNPDEADLVKEVADIIQIPAFLCRQTDLILSAALTKKVVNIKKGQFLAPEDVRNIIEKVESKDNFNILLTERGTSFGYHNLVVDMRSLIIMRSFGYPVIFDVTHSLQLPGGKGKTSGGLKDFAFYLARAAVSVGIDGIFIETHPNPQRALSDKDTMVPLKEIPKLIEQLKAIDMLVKNMN